MAKSSRGKVAPGNENPCDEGGTGGCKVGDLLHLLGKNHMLAILGEFSRGQGPLRFVELQRELRISPNTLSGRLRELVDAGLLNRTTFNEIPPRVNYEPTPKAIELFTIFAELGGWAKKNNLEAQLAVKIYRPRKR